VPVLGRLVAGVGVLVLERLLREERTDRFMCRPQNCQIRIAGFTSSGAAYGCGEGQCGACTVLIDGVPVRSCTTPCGSVGPQKITTIEGLERDGRLHPLQEAMLDAGAFQCAYCASGMIMTGVALLTKNPNPTDAEIARFMDGNLCRCGDYGPIIEGIKLAAVRGAKGGTP